MDQQQISLWMATQMLDKCLENVDMLYTTTDRSCDFI